MYVLHNPKTRLALMVALTLVLVFGMVRSVWAGVVVEGETIPSGEVIDDDAVITGDNVVVDGRVIGDMLAVGGSVTINGAVEGSLVVLGQDVVINGEVGGTTYVGAAMLELGESAALNRNLYFGGVRVSTQPGSQIGRDLIAAGLGAQLSGAVGREVKAVLGILEWIDLIRDSLSLAPQGVAVASVAADTNGVDGTVSNVLLKSRGLAAPAPANLYDAGRAGVAATSTQARSRIDTDAIADWFADRFSQFLILLVVGGLVMWLLPSQFESWSDGVRIKPLPAAGYGLVTFVVGYAAAALLAVFLLAAGIFVGLSIAWELTLSFWALGYSSLILAFFVFVLFISHISKAVVAYLAGYLIVERLAPRVTEYRVVSLMLGLLFYVALVAVPTLGGLVGFIVTILGLGSVWVAHLDRRRRKKEQALGTAEPEVGKFATISAGAEVPIHQTQLDQLVARVATTDASMAEAVALAQQLAQQHVEARTKDVGKRNGPWSYNEALGSSAASPFDRAVLAVMGIGAAGKDHNVNYIAATDSDGEPLNAETEYKITGKDLDARWWSITAYNPNYLIPSEEHKYSISKSTITMDEEGKWEAYLTPHPRDDHNWIHSGGGDTDLALALRLYNPGPQVVEGMGLFELPAIHPADQN